MEHSAFYQITMAKRKRAESSSKAPLSAFAARQLNLEQNTTKEKKKRGNKNELPNEGTEQPLETMELTSAPLEDHSSSKQASFQVLVPGIDRSGKTGIDQPPPHEGGVDVPTMPSSVQVTLNKPSVADESSPSPLSASPSLVEADAESRSNTPSSSFNTSLQKEDLRYPYTHLTETNSVRVKDALFVGLHSGEKLAMVGTYLFACARGGFSLFGASYACRPKNERGQIWHSLNVPLMYPTPIFVSENISNTSVTFNSVESTDSSSSTGHPATESVESTSISDFENALGVNVDSLLPSFETVLVFKMNDIGISKIPRVSPFAKRLFNMPSLLENASSLSSSFEIIPDSWKTFADSMLSTYASSMHTPPKLLICGPKGAGKSTCCRYLTNRLVNCTDYVAFLDIDPGQPEVVPFGHISLYFLNSPLQGPAFCRLLSNVRSFRIHIGESTPQRDPTHYLASTFRLFSEYQKFNFERELEGKPPVSLIINCPGWMKGGGAELLFGLVNQISPTEVVYLSRSYSRSNQVDKKSIYQHKEGIPEFLLQATHFKFSQLESSWQYLPDPNAHRISSADNRKLGLLSYLHFDIEHNVWDFTRSLAVRQPLATSFSGPQHGIDAVNIIGEPLNLMDISKAINGTLLALCAYEVSNEKEWNDNQIVETPEGIPVLVNDGLPLDPANAQCFGLVLLRSIDLVKKEFHFVGPINLDLLADAYSKGMKIVLERGRLELPLSTMLDRRLVVLPELPYLERNFASIAAGSQRRRIRRNIVRRGGLTG
ncbi:AAA family ATPase Grc3 [Schizosaccharomyces cryophilus OY26]|uniref:Polynucleotide 5'-hydroxyl-kinase GRC3 n=1 Tax=Schizosaccharomyces cryophilus (strain OY26 / ATCC MYA-4695 / CBS 11777 / NBRC 106824 / NRRL Y48691) TaxID=653667 RepID=S9VZC0_SCHCR|nr:AAA family ATPase Grc3 [Schizosaccharomyces cryophilus OY26]EPY51150.1 AAA family ATPase Grc3 [Schizosaccharomyces cryophilus OY26]